MRIVARATLFVVVALAYPAVAFAATSAGQPFPANLYTAADPSQNTGLRVDLPKPDCAAAPVGLRGHRRHQHARRLQHPAPHLGSVLRPDRPLDGVELDDLPRRPRRPRRRDQPGRVGARDEHAALRERRAARAALDLPAGRHRGVHAADGTPLDGTTFRHDLNFGQTKDPAAKAYRKALLDALPMAMAGGAEPSDIAAVSLFTTQSIDAVSEKIRAQLRASTPTFLLGSAGERTVFPLAVDRVDPVAPPDGHGADLRTAVPSDAGSRRRRRRSRSARTRRPTTRTAAKVIPPYGTATGTPVAQGTNQVAVHACSCRRASRPPAAGRSRSSATGSPTARTARRGPSPATLAARGHRDDRDQRRRPRRRRARHATRSCRAAGAAGRRSRRRTRHRPGRQRHDRLDRGRQRRRRARDRSAAATACARRSST